MKKAVVIAAILIVLGFTHSIFFFGGVALGGQPTSDEIQQENMRQVAVSDMASLVGGYKQTTDLCEERYQAALVGDYDEAFILQGQMNATYQQINSILEKYSSNNTPIY